MAQRHEVEEGGYYDTTFLEFGVVILLRTISPYRRELAKLALDVLVLDESDHHRGNKKLKKKIKIGKQTKSVDALPPGEDLQEKSTVEFQSASINADNFYEFEFHSILSSDAQAVEGRTIFFALDAFGRSKNNAPELPVFGAQHPGSVLYDLALRSMSGTDVSDVRLDAFSRRMLSEQGITGASHPRSLYANARLLSSRCEHFADS